MASESKILPQRKWSVGGAAGHGTTLAELREARDDQTRFILFAEGEFVHVREMLASIDRRLKAIESGLAAKPKLKYQCEIDFDGRMMRTWTRKDGARRVETHGAGQVKNKWYGPDGEFIREADGEEWKDDYLLPDEEDGSDA